MKTQGWRNVPSRNLAHFLRSASGSIAMSFALASPVLLAAAGLAIDYSTHSMKVRVQAAAMFSHGAARELALAGSTMQPSSLAAYYVRGISDRDQQ